MTLFYIDSSVGLQALLNTPQRSQLITWMNQEENQFVSSRLLRTEITRVLKREGEPITAGEALLARVGLLPITEKIHQQAEAISIHVKTLDALHLATALIFPDVITLATHDSHMAAVATELGLPVLDPVNT